MIGLYCSSCPFAFEVGSYVYWDLDGGCTHCVCRKCGTMHRIEHLDGKPDRLFAQPGPIRAMMSHSIQDCAGNEHLLPTLGIMEESWHYVRDLTTPENHQYDPVIANRFVSENLRTIACFKCGEIGHLTSGEWKVESSRCWQETCPRCGGNLEFAYDKTIN